MYLNLDLLRPRYWGYLGTGIWALLLAVGPSDAESTQVQGDDQSATFSHVIACETVSTEAKDLLLHNEIPEITFPDRLPQTPLAQNNQDRVIAQTDAQGATTASSGDLAKQSQNPIASLISVPFQNNTNFGVGEFNRTNNTLNIQPVIPLSLSDSLSLVSRPIVPVIYQPELARIPLPNGDVESIGDDFGLGDIIYQGYFVPKSASDFTWGIGPVLLFPTATATSLGTGKWGAGPGAVAVLTTGNIVAGGLINNIWSYAGDSSRSDVSLMTFQPFFNYNFKGGWYASTAPVITANWLGTGEKWTVPVGGGFGRVFKIGEQHVNMSLSAYWNAVKPEEAADWTLRFQVTLLFPR